MSEIDYITSSRPQYEMSWALPPHSLPGTLEHALRKAAEHAIDSRRKQYVFRAERSVVGALWWKRTEVRWVPVLVVDASVGDARVLARWGIDPQKLDSVSTVALYAFGVGANHLQRTWMMRTDHGDVVIVQRIGR